MIQNAYNESESKEIKTEVLDFNLDSAKADASCTRESYAKHERLTQDKVREIKALMDECTNKELAETYACSATTISKIRTGYRWKNV